MPHPDPEPVERHIMPMESDEILGRNYRERTGPITCFLSQDFSHTAVLLPPLASESNARRAATETVVSPSRNVHFEKQGLLLTIDPRRSACLSPWRDEPRTTTIALLPCSRNRSCGALIVWISQHLEEAHCSLGRSFLAAAIPINMARTFMMSAMV
jgi:hypothetical protein